MYSDQYQTDLFNNAKENLKALDDLFLKSATYRNSQQFFELLYFINRFPNLSPFNAFLIHMQNSGVRIVFSAAKWALMGRTIKPYARPLVILIPFGPVEFVWDISDTEGAPIPKILEHPYSTRGKFNKVVLKTTIKNCEKHEIIYRESNMHISSAGFARRGVNHFIININKNYPLNEKYSTLVHELGHIIAGHLGIMEKSWWKDRADQGKRCKEIEAESISFLVCKRFGLETSSEAYLSDYIRLNEQLPVISLDSILTVAGYIEQMGSLRFKAKKNSRG